MEDNNIKTETNNKLPTDSNNININKNNKSFSNKIRNFYMIKFLKTVISCLI